MPPPTRRPTDEVARLGKETHAKLVRPKLLTADDGKFVALDILTGDYEIDEDDYTAIMQLRTRSPAAEIWLERAGHPTAYKMGMRLLNATQGGSVVK